MKIKKVFIIAICMIGLIGSVFISMGDTQNLKFTCNGIDYDLNIYEIADKENIDLDMYPYYVIIQDRDSNINIYYSSSRITMKKSGSLVFYSFNNRIF